jgi:hypothetical protein
MIAQTVEGNLKVRNVFQITFDSLGHNKRTRSLGLIGNFVIMIVQTITEPASNRKTIALPIAFDWRNAKNAPSSKATGAISIKLDPNMPTCTLI